MIDQALLQQFGSELRAAREAAGRSVDEIAKQTRIHRRYIDAIEAGDLASLPPGPYVPAFLREFARAVGLKVPPEFAITSSINHGLTTATLQSAPVVRNQSGNSISGSVTKTAVETAKLAGSVAKTAVKTTGSVIKAVEGGVNDAVGVFTSRSLREEADLVRRERLGLAKFPEEARDAITPEATAETTPEATAAEYSTQEEIDEQIIDEQVEEEVVVQEIAPKKATSPKATKAVKAPMIPLEISSDDPISGNATLKLGKASKKFPVTNLVIFALLIAFGFVAYYAIRDVKEKTRPDNSQNELMHDEDLPATAPATVEEPAPAAAEPAKDITGAATTPVDDSLRFQLKATDLVWVSIGSDANAPFRGELKAGDVKTFTASERFVVNIGNQKALDMMFNGTRLSNLPTIKNSGMVVRNLVLTKDRVSLNGAEVSTNSASAASSSATPTKPAATNTSAKPATNAPAISKSLPVSKPLTTKPSAITKSSTTSTVKKPTTTTKTPAKKAAPKKIPIIKPVEPKPATAN